MSLHTADNIIEKQGAGYNICFSIAAIDLTVNQEPVDNWAQCPPLLSSFLAPTHDFRSTMLSFKWIKDDNFFPAKISDPSYAAVKRKWLDIFVDGREQIFSHIVNNTWTVFYSAHRGHALGIGPKECFFDIFSSALDLAYIQLSMAKNFFMLHSAAVIVSGKCLLFLAVSGGGKTTLSKNAIHHGYEVLSDDRVFVLQNSNGYFVHGTPFGKVGLNKGGYPIAGVFLLEQSDQNFVESISAMEIFLEVYFSEYNRRRRFFGSAAASGFFSTFMEFLDNHPKFRLHFRKDFDDWEYVSQFVESANMSSKA